MALSKFLSSLQLCFLPSIGASVWPASQGARVQEEGGNGKTPGAQEALL